MKHSHLFLIIFLSIPAFCIAQSTRYGVKAGINLSTFGGTNIDATLTSGFSGGLVVDKEKTDQRSSQYELLYSSLGSQSRFNSSDKIKLHYLQYAMALKTRVFYTFNVWGGPYIGYLLKAEQFANDDRINIRDDYKRMDFGLGIGIYYEVEEIQIGVRYNLGLININNRPNSPEQYREVNQAFQIAACYFFLH